MNIKHYLKNPMTVGIIATLVIMFSFVAYTYATPVKYQCVANYDRGMGTSSFNIELKDYGQYFSVKHNFKWVTSGILFNETIHNVELGYDENKEYRFGKSHANKNFYFADKSTGYEYSINQCKVI